MFTSENAMQAVRRRKRLRSQIARTTRAVKRSKLPAEVQDTLITLMENDYSLGLAMFDIAKWR